MLAVFAFHCVELDTHLVTVVDLDTKCPVLQGHSEEAMLHAIVNNAATWMKNGLNISTYKLVIYISNEETLTHFAKLKAKHSDGKVVFDRINYLSNICY